MGRWVVVVSYEDVLWVPSVVEQQDQVLVVAGAQNDGFRIVECREGQPPLACSGSGFGRFRLEESVPTLGSVMGVGGLGKS